MASQPSLLPSKTKTKLKKGKINALDGLVVDLYNKVDKVLEPSQLISANHVQEILAIHRILAQIQKYEKPLSTNGKLPRSREERTDILKQWLTEKGVSLDGIRLEPNATDTGPGVIASRSFQEGDRVLSIPQNLLLSVFSAVQRNPVRILLEKDSWFRDTPSLVLAVLLLFEKHQPEAAPSFWKGYIDSLPSQNVDSASEGTFQEGSFLPLTLSPESVEALDGTTAVLEYFRTLRTVAKQYCHMRSVLRQLASLSPEIQAATSWFTYTEFRWAAWIVMSRHFVVRVKVESAGGAVQTLALVPLADSIQKQEGRVSWRSNIESSQFELDAMKSFNPEEQVFASFGGRPNVSLLLFHGFLPQKNSLDRIRLAVDLDPADPTYTKKISLLRWLEVSPTAQLDLFWDGSVSLDLARWLRVAILEGEEEVTSEIRSVVASKAQATARLLEEKAAIESKGEGEEGTKRYAKIVELLSEKVGGASENGSHAENGEETCVGVLVGKRESTLLLKLLERKLEALRSKGLSEVDTRGNGSLEGKGGRSEELTLVLKLRNEEIATLSRGISRCQNVGGRE